ncbi:MAG: hypothetical protein LBT14_02165 [Treponema sp.]|jgi:hypothetical protein|nr:hypothetical protein [Treponema sp.]
MEGSTGAALPHLLMSFRDIEDSAGNIVLVVQVNPWGAHLIDGFWLKSVILYRILY